MNFNLDITTEELDVTIMALENLMKSGACPEKLRPALAEMIRALWSVKQTGASV